MERLALVSVWDKTGLAEFAKVLSEQGITLLSTGGTAKYLAEQGLEVLSVSDYTGHPEILGGRVKTLHPKVHGGILARRNLESDLAELATSEITPIDFVVVNLYPFTDKVKEVEAAKNPNHESLIEFIDIGGPTMIRAAAKNFEHVVVISNPSDYQVVADELKEKGAVSIETRRRLAANVFKTMAAYDASIARYLSLDEKLLDEEGLTPQFAPVEAIVLEKKETLRYGENPHQQAALYDRVVVGGKNEPAVWEKLQGKEISYNNLVDMQAAVDLLVELSVDLQGEQAAVVIKHTNPCGAAIRPTTLEAFQAARDCDPISAFGGIIALSGVLDGETAKLIVEGFVEVVLAEEISKEAKEVFAKKKNVRLVKCDFSELRENLKAPNVVIKKSFDDYLLQSDDIALAEISAEKVVSGDATPEILADLDFAWRVCKHVKSNTIVLAKNKQAIGVGAGQMSRVDAAHLSIQRAKTHGFSAQGAVSASDAFLPFPDTLEVLNDAGVVALVQPGGSIKDDAVIDSAKSRNMVMVLTGERHFRH